MVDADGQQGMENYTALELPSTLTVKTGRGEHHYFCLSAGEDAGNSASALTKGVDVRGTGGYVVYPPSVHASGAQYEFLPWQGAITEAPAKLLAVSSDPEQPIQVAMPLVKRLDATDRDRIYAWQALEEECRDVECAAPGTRNDILNRAAFAIGTLVGAGWLEHDRACEALWAACTDYRSSDGDAEAWKTIYSGLNAGVASPRGPLAPYTANGPVLVTAVTTAVPVDAPWTDPEPLGSKLSPVDKLTLEMLPISLRDMVQDVSERMQVPLDFPGVVAVQALAGVVGRRAFIQPKKHDTSFRVVPNLWGGIVAPPSSMKSPTIKAITGALQDLGNEWLQEYTAAKESFDMQAGLDELAQDAWKSAAKKDMRNGNSPAPPPMPVTAAPKQKRLITSDATFEALHGMMAANPAGIFLLKDELTGWFAGLERQGREQERGFALESWNGDGFYTVDRVGRGSIHVPYTCLSIFGSIQPSRLRAYLADALRGGPSNDGLMQRFQLLIWPDMPEGEWAQVDRIPNKEASEKVGAIFRRLACMCAEEPLGFYFNSQAQALYTDWITGLENRLRSRCTGEVMEAHLGKYRSLMPSLALLFALADGETQCVTLHHAKLAAQWCDYLETHARRVYSAQASPERSAAITLGQHIAAGELGRRFSLRDVYRKCWHGLGSKEEAVPAIKQLEELGWLRLATGNASKPGRPASETFIVNPTLGAHHGKS